MAKVNYSCEIGNLWSWWQSIT